MWGLGRHKKRADVKGNTTEHTNEIVNGVIQTKPLRATDTFIVPAGGKLNSATIGLPGSRGLDTEADYVVTLGR